MENCIEKDITIAAPISRVWKAITDSREFGEWFRVRLETPFAAGESTGGQILHPGYEHVRLTVTVQRVEPETLFSFTWLPYAIDPNIDYTGETPTTVEFHLSATADGTHLRVTECGFDKVPEHRRELAFRMNEKGWAAQVGNIRKYVEDTK